MTAQMIYKNTIVNCAVYIRPVSLQARAPGHLETHLSQCLTDNMEISLTGLQVAVARSAPGQDTGDWWQCCKTENKQIVKQCPQSAIVSVENENTIIQFV